MILLNREWKFLIQDVNVHSKYTKIGDRSLVGTWLDILWNKWERLGEVILYANLKHQPVPSYRKQPQHQIQIIESNLVSVNLQTIITSFLHFFVYKKAVKRK